MNLTSNKWYTFTHFKLAYIESNLGFDEMM